jgi:mono/diheme cytochrome c family protein
VQPRLIASILFASLAIAGCHGNSTEDDDFCCVTDDGGFDEPFGGPQPSFGTTVTQAVPPPPISGGTLTVLASGTTAVAADPDRDRIYVVDLTAQKKIADVLLQAGDEPGRVLEDGKGRVHVVLRRGGAIVTLDPTTWTVTARRAVCAAPRGVAWDSNGDQLYVACAGGEFITMPAAGGAITNTAQLDRDLRDVVVTSTGIYVSRFRSAELLTVDSTGTILARATPTAFGFDPDGAWRLSPATDGSLFMLHQRGSQQQIDTIIHGGYGGSDPCNSPIVQSTITHWQPGTQPDIGPTIAGAVVPVDFALAHQSTAIAVISAGNAKTPGLPTVLLAHTDGTDGSCTDGGSLLVADGKSEPTAVAYTPSDVLIVQSREPAELILPATSVTIPLSVDSRADTGHAVFHSNAGASIACASCHMEGGDDGRVWSFVDSGQRRTQSLRGGIVGTEPFHWDGDQANFSMLMQTVFVGRMSGPTLGDDQLNAMEGWVNHIPLIPKTIADPDAVTRGSALFNDPTVGCAGCHNGTHFTNNVTINVGTGAAFQVPALQGVVERAPYLHDGRAPTLTDRFTSLGGGDHHGNTSQLTSAQIADLVAYLGSI